MIKEDYVSFEIAKLLKEKGFDWCTYAYYEDEDNPNISLCASKAINWNKTEFISKPTLQMAMKWLREVHKIDIAVYPYGDYSSENYQFDVYKNRDLMVSKDNGYMTYEQACEAAIKYCLEHLI